MRPGAKSIHHTQDGFPREMWYDSLEDPPPESAAEPDPDPAAEPAPQRLAICDGAVGEPIIPRRPTTTRPAKKRSLSQ